MTFNYATALVLDIALVVVVFSALFGFIRPAIAIDMLAVICIPGLIRGLLRGMLS